MIKLKFRSLWFSVCFLIKFGLSLHSNELKFKRSEAYLVESDIQPSEQDVPLEDFFWTGSGDGPLYVKPNPPHDHKHPNSFVRTATILATVYIDGNYESDVDPLCVFDCDKNSDERKVVESFERIPVTDRRYWLLTVVAGILSPQDFPILEEKLAKLYRIAFLRQQAKHLGIANGFHSDTNLTDPDHVTRNKRFVNKFIEPTNTSFNGSHVTFKRFEINRHVYERQVSKMRKQRRSTKWLPDSNNSKLPLQILLKDVAKNQNRTFVSNQNFMQKVFVMIHKLEKGNEIDTEKNTQHDDNLNQTEIVYSVSVGGKPVLAATAAEDMKLIDMDEVIKIMENDVFLKAEPYLKDPQATPLSPSYMNSSSTVSTYINQNPILIGLLSLALILLILLIITLLFYGHSKRKLIAESKRQQATQALVQKINVDDEIRTLCSDSVDVVSGVDNFAFDKEYEGGDKKKPPVLHFPLPPANRPSSSSSTTSDSSFYYPKRKYKLNNILNLLNENNENVNDDLETIYTKVQSASKSSKSHSKSNRRKYRSSNRVSSVENVDVHTYHGERNAFNDESFKDGQVEDELKARKEHESGKYSTAEAINKELIQRKARVASADSNSIGSFLSMVSVRSFPKCTVPEPLSRVLEPVSVTHLDHSDGDYENFKNYRTMESNDFDEVEIGQEVPIHSDGADPGIVGPVVWEMHKKGLDQSMNLLNSPLRNPHQTQSRFEGLLQGAMKLYGSSSYSNCHSALHKEESQQMPGAIKTRDMRGKSAATIRLTSRTFGLLSRSDLQETRPMTAGPTVSQQAQQIPSIKAWTSGSGSQLVRPLSAGVYHKPNLSIAVEELENSQLKQTTSASPILDAIQNELKRFSNEEK